MRQIITPCAAITILALPAFPNDLTGKMEVSAFGGAVEYPRSLGNTNATYGGSFGLGVYSRVVLFGEVSNTTPRDLLDYNEPERQIRTLCFRRDRRRPLRE
jgi:hypothetical protein